MSVEIQESEVEDVAEAIDTYLAEHGSPKRSTREVKVKLARLILVSERLREALQAASPAYQEAMGKGKTEA